MLAEDYRDHLPCTGPTPARKLTFDTATVLVQRASPWLEGDPEMPELLPGVYEHYNGGRYRVMFLAKDSTNAREVEGRRPMIVVYWSFTKGEPCTRDLHEFLGVVSVRTASGELAKNRFEWVSF